MPNIDLNVDAGEGVGNESQIFPLVSSANIACGAHAGSLPIALEAAELAASVGLRIGCHPGFPDKAGFGRREPGDGWTLAPDAIWDSLVMQLESIVDRSRYLKPHGALYNLATEPGQAAAWVEGLIERFRLPLMGLPGTYHEAIARHGFIREGFADRRYTADGRLTPRSEPGAVFHEPDQIAAGVLSLAERVDSICIHGDHEHAVETAALVRRTLEKAGWTISAER
ncbi:MAG: hypothetical protein HONBIEJF_02109 [Fimbriimonadaceae bacterium]|nr:hypothetical protein [Fimbriimonadaceae bacterium]